MLGGACGVWFQALDVGLTLEFLVVRFGSCPEAVPVKGVVQERPILENSTACTMSNAKNLAWLDPFLAVMIVMRFLWNIDIKHKASQ